MTYSPGSFTALVDHVTEAEWNSLLDRFADASIYQTWAYGAVSWGESQLSHLVLLRDGAPVAIAQLRIVRVPVIGSGIAYVRWGPVFRPKDSQCDPAVWHAATEALIEEYVRRRGLTLRVLPFVFRQDAVAPAIESICSDAGFVTGRHAGPSLPNAACGRAASTGRPTQSIRSQVAQSIERRRAEGHRGD